MRSARRSQEERKSKRVGVGADALDDLTAWRDARQAQRRRLRRSSATTPSRSTRRSTAVRHLDDGRVAVMLRESPFYAESGGQISDHGEIVGDGWRVDVDEVKKVEGRPAAIGQAHRRRSRSAARPRACRAIGGATPSAITRRRTCCTRRCARCWARACIRRARSSRPTACASTSRTTAPSTRSDSAEIEAIVNREIWRSTGRDDARDAVPGSACRGRDGAVRREVRRRRARRDDSRLLDGAVRRHARAQHGARSACSRSSPRPASRRACAASRR